MEENKILISVVISLYNKAHTIVDTLNTVLTQTFKKFEVVIVDDGSTDDGVLRIQENFNDDRIKIIRQVNAGVSSARNTGVEHSVGAYIAFMDADDKWNEDYLLIMSQAIHMYPQAVMYSSGGICTNVDNTHLSYRLCNKYLNKILKVDYFENPFVFSHTSSTVVKKEAFLESCKFPADMKCLEDFALFYDLALCGDFVYIGLPISKYIGGVEGQITASSPEKRFSFMPSVVQFYNMTFETYLRNYRKDKYFKLYFKYDLRHRIKCCLHNEDEKWIDFFLSNVDKKALSVLSFFELFLYKNKLKKLSILWIKMTKVIWRMHKFPVVGERVDENLINKKYRVW